MNAAQEVFPTVQQSLNAIRRSVERFEAVAPVLEQGAREFSELGGRCARPCRSSAAPTTKSARWWSRPADRPRYPADHRGVAGRDSEFRLVGERVNVLLQTNEARITAAFDQATGRAPARLAGLERREPEEPDRHAQGRAEGDGQSRRHVQDADDLLKDARITANRVNTTLSNADM